MSVTLWCFCKCSWRLRILVVNTATEKKKTTLIYSASNLCTAAKTLCAALQKSSSPCTSTELWSFSSLWTLAISCSFFSRSFSLWRREQGVLNNNTSYDSAFWKWHGSVHLNNRNHNHQKHWLKTRKKTRQGDRWGHANSHDSPTPTKEVFWQHRLSY